MSSPGGSGNATRCRKRRDEKEEKEESWVQNYRCGLQQQPQTPLTPPLARRDHGDGPNPPTNGKQQRQSCCLPTTTNRHVGTHTHKCSTVLSRSLSALTHLFKGGGGGRVLSFLGQEPGKGSHHFPLLQGRRESGHPMVSIL